MRPAIQIIAVLMVLNLIQTALVNIIPLLPIWQKPITPPWLITVLGFPRLMTYLILNTMFLSFKNILVTKTVLALVDILLLITAGFFDKVFIVLLGKVYIVGIGWDWHHL